MHEMHGLPARFSVNNSYRPLRSLKEGHWFKLICGASFQHLPAIRSLTLAYALAGADCIDVAADPAVIEAARSALQVASALAESAQHQGFARMEGLPWLMVSLNDGEDPHFRKAEFDPNRCPSDCPRPCEKICPATAIAFTPSFAGVIDNRCYGCGRCIPLCPIDQIQTRSYVYSPDAIAPLVLSGVDALEIHTQVGRFDDFQRLWTAISPYIQHLKLIAVSCPDGEVTQQGKREDVVSYLRSLYELISPLPCPLIWQTDGRPMSGDIGDGATRATVKLGQKVLAANLPGYVQLAGGTNRHTVAKLRELNLLKEEEGAISGIAYGSYARVLLSPVLERLENADCACVIPTRLEAIPDLLWQAVNLADSLISPLKMPMKVIRAVSKH